MRSRLTLSRADLERVTADILRLFAGGVFASGSDLSKGDEVGPGDADCGVAVPVTQELFFYSFLVLCALLSSALFCAGHLKSEGSSI